MSEGFAGAKRVPVWTQPDGEGPVPFVAWGSALRQAFGTPASSPTAGAGQKPHFVPWGEVANREPEQTGEPEFVPVDEEHEPEAPAEPAIDVEALRADAMAQGFASGLEAGRREADKERAALGTLAAGLDALKPEPTLGLGAMIAATVERLVRQTMGEVEIDRATLLARAQAAAALIGEETQASVLKLSPADLKRLEGADLPVPCEADPALAPGALRLETGAGAIEDGPALRLERLRAALDKVAAQR